VTRRAEEELNREANAKRMARVDEMEREANARKIQRFYRKRRASQGSNDSDDDLDSASLSSINSVEVRRHYRELLARRLAGDTVPPL
jgi:hypothetical protein